MRDSTRPLLLALLAAVILGSIVLIYAKISPTFQYNFTRLLKSNADYYPKTAIAYSIDIEADDTELPADGKSTTNIYAYPITVYKDSVPDQKLVFKAKLGHVSEVSVSDDGGYVVEYTAGTKKGVDVITVKDNSTFRKIKNSIKITLN